MVEPEPTPKPERTSERLRSLVQASSSERIGFGELIDGLGDRAFGLPILILTLPNCIPGPSMPGLSTVTGLPILPIALQMALGRPRPTLPGFISRRSLPRKVLVGVLDRGARPLAAVERAIRPRWPLLTSPLAERLLGAYIVLLTLFLMLPLPFGPFLTAWALLALSFGLIEKDGAAIALGVVLGTVAMAFNAALVILGEAVVSRLFT